LWAAQAIYARAFYAAGNTLTPMLASTIITVISLPIYWSLFHSLGAPGLAIASDLGILLQTGTLAILLHRRKLVTLGGLEVAELARALLAAAVSAVALIALSRALPPAGTFRNDALTLTLGTLLWIAISYAVLHFTGSALPAQLIARFRRAEPSVQSQAADIQE
jgi:putative peptidoglycan lipid II flippase